MAIDYNGLKKVVDNAKFGYYEELSFTGLTFLLFPCEYTSEDKQRKSPPIFYQPSSLADWDIYFGMNVIPRPFRKPCLLHEIVEIISFLEIRWRPNLSPQQALKQAHDTAIGYDNQYAKEILNKQKFKKYLCLRAKFPPLDY